jgi:hypothetical protein
VPSGLTGTPSAETLAINREAAVPGVISHATD